MKQIIKIFALIGFVLVGFVSCGEGLAPFTYTYADAVVFGLVNKTQQNLTIETVIISKTEQSDTYYKVSKNEVIKGDSCYFYEHLRGSALHWGKTQVEKAQALLFSETDPNDIKYRYGADGYNKILCEKCIRISIYDVDGNLLREWTPANNNGRSPFNFIGKEWGLYWEREILVGETLNFDNRNQRVKVALVYPITEEDITPAEE